MKITVRVKPNSRPEGVVQSDDGVFIIRVAAPPAEGKANARVIALLARHFSVPKSQISIIRGISGRNKVIEIS